MYVCMYVRGVLIETANHHPLCRSQLETIQLRNYAGMNHIRKARCVTMAMYTRHLIYLFVHVGFADW